jgi:hypothetical protein
MFDIPVSGWYAYAGVAATSLVLFGVAAALPTAPPPDAAAAARAVDATAASEYAATAVHPLAADAVRLSPRGLTLDGGGGRAHATFRYGSVTPVRPGTALAAVLTGARPATVFDTPEELVAAAAAARARTPTWRPAPDRLRIRRVTWRGVNVTLVG